MLLIQSKSIRALLFWEMRRDEKNVKCEDNEPTDKIRGL